MRAVVQRVTGGCVRVGEDTVGRVGAGYVVLLGVHVQDTETEATALADKVANLRIFDDDAGKLNRSILDVRGEVLSVSQFTLYGNTEKGRRPSFLDAAPPERAEALYQVFNDRLRALGVPVSTGRFRAVMTVEIHNDGPVTLLLDVPPATAR